MTERLDQAMVNRGLVATRSQAESYVKLGKVEVDGNVIEKPGLRIVKSAVVQITSENRYVSRGGFKLESIASKLGLDFHGMNVLDVGSSTGGFTDYALQHGAANVVAVDAGTYQLAESLRANPKIDLHEQTDIKTIKSLSTKINITLIDVSFTSVRPILQHLLRLIDPGSVVVAMVKPQFEAGAQLKHKGIIKNQKMRRDIFKDFEGWVKDNFKIIDKADSQVAGEKGNVEKFYKLVVLG